MTPPSYPPPCPAAAANGDDPRLTGVSADDIPDLIAAARALRDGRFAQAESLLQAALARYPAHPELLRRLGFVRLGTQGRHGEAVGLLRRALAQWPDDAALWSDLGIAHSACRQRGEAIAAWRRACALDASQPMPWFNLGRALQFQGETAAAVEALERALALAPDLLPARILAGDARAHLGDFDRAAAHYREALRVAPGCGDAWRGLANIKTRPPSEADIATLRAQLARPGVREDDWIAMSYALGKAEEDRGRYPDAFAAIAAANARMRAKAPWRADALRGYVRAALRATEALPAPLDPTLGREVVFIVGMPRSGSTLIEQILSAHPQVAGASELPDLAEIVQEESVRRGRPYPDWVADATAADWRRLGREYLDRTARWRGERPRFTDKMPENWKHAGVLRAMLPGATVIEARRDALETGWSCYRQQFYQLPHFACDLRDIGVYIRTCEAAMDRWRARDPARQRLQHYERLLADFENEVRALLAACGLDFDERCLAFHRAQRSVRTASAAQVRQPLMRDTARAAAYGVMLNPLVQALSDAMFAGPW